MNHSLQTLNRNCRSQASLPAAVVLYLISIRANKAAAALPSARLVPCDSGWGWRRASASAAVCADPWRSDRRPSKARKLKRKKERERKKREAERSQSLKQPGIITDMLSAVLLGTYSRRRRSPSFALPGRPQPQHTHNMEASWRF
jgi:hypothetical protein